MAIYSGFFNALKVQGVYDRVYEADDYNDNLAAFLSTGVRRSGDNDLKVTASGLNVSVGKGRAIVEGHWVVNDTAYAVKTVTAPASLSRLDGVFVHLDTNEATRAITIIYKEGTAAASPTAPACVRAGGVYEIMLATVLVAANATNVTVTDTRADKDVCGWVRSPIGYDDYFEAMDSAFDDWFDEMEGQLSTDAAGNLQNQISAQNAVIMTYAPVELYSFDPTDDDQDIDEVFALSQAVTNFERVDFEFSVMDGEFTFLTASKHFESSLAYDAYLHLVQPNVEGDSTYSLAGYSAEYKIDHTDPSKMTCIARRNTDNNEYGEDGIRIWRVLGYGNRNAPPVAPYNEVISNPASITVEEVTE